jgi:hypothetical protein
MVLEREVAAAWEMQRRIGIRIERIRRICFERTMTG